MKRFVGSALVFAMIFAGLTGCVRIEQPAAQTATAKTIEEVEDSPRDDFFTYINRESLENAEFKYGEDVAEDEFELKKMNRINAVIDEVLTGSGYEEGTEEYLVDKAYRYYVDYDFDNCQVPEDLKAMFDKIASAKTIDELLKADAEACREFGLGPILNIENEFSIDGEGKRMITFLQMTGVLGTEFRELKKDYAPLDDLRDLGADVEREVNDSANADDMGLDLAYLVMDLYYNTDPEILQTISYHKYVKVISRGELAVLFDGADIIGYLKALGYEDPTLDEIMAIDNDQFSCLAHSLNDENLDAYKAWETCRLFRKYSNFLTPTYEDLKIYATADYRSTDEQAKHEIAYNMTELVDILYVEKYHDKKTDDYLRKMCDDIKDGYRGLISDADWLSEETREALLTKLENIVYVTGIDAKRHDPNDYLGLCGDNWYEFYRNYNAKHLTDELGNITEPLDRHSPGMAMAEVNACYSRAKNNITITCGIMQDPIFDINADYWTNLGGIGMVIGHEMGHAFDSDGMEFDMNGRYDPTWIDAKDIEALKARNEEAVHYFQDNFTVCNVYHVDGAKTLTENYADLGSMECIVSRTSTKEERELLFTNYAKMWTTKTTKAMLFDQLETDEHSPNYLRVNSILSTTDAFYETYGVKEGDGMYVAPDKRISRWH